MVVWDTLCFHSTLCCRDNAVFFGNYQILFQTADIGLLFANIVPEVCLFVILHRTQGEQVEVAFDIDKSAAGGNSYE